MSATDPRNEQREKLVKERDVLEREVTRRAREAAGKVVATRPQVNRELTEECLASVAARAVKCVASASTANPKPATGSRIAEFEAWSADDGTRHVALASHGARAEGAKSAVAEDFPEASAAHLAIDGRLGEQWLVGNPAVLTVTFAKTETIDRVSFHNTKDLLTEGKAQGATPADYEIQVSADGETWRTVASNTGREPWSAAHGIERMRREVTTPEEAKQLAAVAAEIVQLDRALKAVPPLREIRAGKYA